MKNGQAINLTNAEFQSHTRNHDQVGMIAHPQDLILLNTSHSELLSDGPTRSTFKLNFLFGFICSCLSQLDSATSLPLAVPSAIVGANAVPCDLPTNQDQIPFLSLLARVTFLILRVCQCTKRQRLILSVFFRSPLLPQLQPKFNQGVIELYDDSAFVPASISTPSALSHKSHGILGYSKCSCHGQNL